MTLSDHEQRILQEIEKNFYEQDPKFARGVAGTTLKAHAGRNVRKGIALFVLGFAVLIAFFVRPAVPVGVVAFLLMLSGAVFAYRSAEKASAGQVKAAREKAAVPGWVEGLSQRMRGFRKRGES